MATETAERPRVSFAEAIAAMGPEERLSIYRSGGLTRAECARWAANHPGEVPLVNDEYEWITLNAE